MLLLTPKLTQPLLQYQLECLKSLCGEYLASKLDIETVTTTLLLADMHQALKLKSKCIDYLNDNATEVMATEGWKSFLGTGRMDLVVELYKKQTIKYQY